MARLDSSLTITPPALDLPLYSAANNMASNHNNSADGYVRKISAQAETDEKPLGRVKDMQRFLMDFERKNKEEAQRHVYQKKAGPRPWEVKKMQQHQQQQEQQKKEETAKEPAAEEEKVEEEPVVEVVVEKKQDVEDVDEEEDDDEESALDDFGKLERFIALMTMLDTGA